MRHRRLRRTTLNRTGGGNPKALAPKWAGGGGPKVFLGHIMPSWARLGCLGPVLGRLGSSWDRLGASCNRFGHLKATLGRLKVVLGRSPGASQGGLGDVLEVCWGGLQVVLGGRSTLPK